MQSGLRQTLSTQWVRDGLGGGPIVRARGGGWEGWGGEGGG